MHKRKEEKKKGDIKKEKKPTYKHFQCTYIQQFFSSFFIISKDPYKSYWTRSRKKEQYLQFLKFLYKYSIFSTSDSFFISLFILFIFIDEYFVRGKKKQKKSICTLISRHFPSRIFRFRFFFFYSFPDKVVSLVMGECRSVMPIINNS